MQVSSLDTVPIPGGEKDVSKPATAASDAFAILLQNTFEPLTNPGLLRLADASNLAQQLSADRDNFVEARPVEENVADEPVDNDDEPVAPEPEKVTEDSRDEDAAVTAAPPETLVFLGNSLISPDARFSPSGAAAAIAVDGQASAVDQQRLAPQRPGAETVSGVTANATNEVSAKNGNTGPSNSGVTDSRISATVTDSGQQLVSRPANTLAAAATLSAQTSKAGGNADATIGNNAPETSGTTGNLLLSNTGGKSMYQGNSQRGASQGAPTITGNPTEVTTNGGNPSSAFTASLATSQTPLPPAGAKPLLGAERAANTLSLEPAALGGQTASAAGSTRPGVLPPTTRPATPPSALREQIAVQVQKAVGQGVDRINIQLKPAELGRLEIKLDVGQDGKVTALVTVERPDTLELLQKDSRGLQQALQDAGLKTDSSGLSFNLRGGDTAPREQTADGGGTANQNDADTTNSDELAENRDESTRRRASDSLIDVEV